MRIRRIVPLALASWLAMLSAGCQDKPTDVQAARPVADMSADVPTDARDLTLGLRLIGIRPLTGGNAGHVVVLLKKRDGVWPRTGHFAAADYNQRSDNEVVLHSLSEADGKITGKMTVVIGPDSPRPRQTGQPNPPDRFTIEFSAIAQPGKTLPHQQDREAFMAPWRKDVPAFGGNLWTGNYQAVRDKDKTEGRLLGATSPSPVPGQFGVTGNADIAPAAGGGMRFTARLAPQKVAPPMRAYAVKYFTTTQDWRDYDGLRITVSAPRRRDDVAVALAIREADGPWYEVTSAALLRPEPTSFTVPFDDFRRTGSKPTDARPSGGDPNYTLDLDRIGGVSIGVSNAEGVGDVAFTVTAVELVSLDGPDRREPADATVTVSPDVWTDFNGTNDVPKGLFGYHDVYHSKPRQAAGKPGPAKYMELLNPGYLRPLDHVGFGAKPITDEQIARRMQARIDSDTEPTDWFYKRAKAGNALDNVVWCHTTDLWARPPWMDRSGDPKASNVEATVKGVRAFYRDLASRAWVPGDDYNPVRKLEVWNEPFIWARHVNMGFRNPPGKRAWTDPTQIGSLPAQLIADVYSKIFLAAVDGARSANKHVLLGGPSAAAFTYDDYAHFQDFVGPFIDQCIGKLDFLTEHHYHGDPASFAASYDVAKAYCDVKHHKRVPIYNTECNDLGGPANARAYYNTRDILECIRVCPDIAKGRAIHALWGGYLRNSGTQNAMVLLNTLRGQRIAVTTSDPDVLAVASSPAPGKLTVVLLNDAPARRTVTLALGDSSLTLQRQRVLEMAGATKLVERAGKAHAAGEPVTVTLASRQPACLEFQASGYRPGRIRKTEQSFVNRTFFDVGPGKEVGGKVLWYAKPDRVARARLRVVTRDVHRGEGEVLVNGKAYPLPWSSGNDGNAVAQEIALDADALAETTTVEFRCGESGNGFTIYAASILIVRPDEALAEDK